MAYVSTTYQRYLGGKAISTGHCVPLVREACGAPHTSEWKRGQLVRNALCESGTAIATFDSNGKYGNHTDGRSHAAILVAIDTDGLRVVDQWIGQPPQERLIRFKGGREGNAVNDGDMFYVIE